MCKIRTGQENQKGDITMKKLILFGLIAVMMVSMLGCSDTKSVSQDPKLLAETAWDTIYGFGDAELFMELTPIKKGTSEYYEAYDYVSDIIRNSKQPDSHILQEYVDVKTNDRDTFNKYVDELVTYGIEGVTAMREYVFSNLWDDSVQPDDEITVCVAKIGNIWYVVDYIP